MDRVRLFAVGLALALTLLAPLYLAAATFAAKSHLVSPDFALDVLVGKGALITFGAALIAAIIASILAFTIEPRGGRGAALVCLIASSVSSGMLGLAMANASAAPRIHDVSTDTQDRPQFSAKITALRSAGSNSPNVGPEAANLQRKAYPGLKTMPFAAPPEDVFDAALSVLQKQELAIVSADKTAGVLEASAETPWFGIKQDVLIRIRATNSGSLIDIRSASHTGDADYGANAKRVKSLLKAIKAELSGGV